MNVALSIQHGRRSCCFSPILRGPGEGVTASSTVMSSREENHWLSVREMDVYLVIQA